MVAIFFTSVDILLKTFHIFLLRLLFWCYIYIFSHYIRIFSRYIYIFSRYIYIFFRYICIFCCSGQYLLNYFHILKIRLLFFCSRQYFVENFLFFTPSFYILMKLYLLRLLFQFFLSKRLLFLVHTSFVPA